jgi:hypothetical protein
VIALSKIGPGSHLLYLDRAGKDEAGLVLLLLCQFYNRVCLEVVAIGRRVDHLSIAQNQESRPSILELFPNPAGVALIQLLGKRPLLLVAQSQIVLQGEGKGVRQWFSARHGSGL